MCSLPGEPPNQAGLLFVLGHFGFGVCACLILPMRPLWLVNGPSFVTICRRSSVPKPGTVFEGSELRNFR